MTEARPYHVLVDVDATRFHSRLRDIEAWLAEWQIDAVIGSVLGTSGQLRVRFADERAAYAFQRCHGGRPIPPGEVAATLAADAEDKNLYDRLAREHPD
jgi:hypothetical protein